MAIAQCQDRWSIVTRPRQWVAIVNRSIGEVIVRHCATDLADGEDEYPETWLLTWAEWQTAHSTTYGMTIDGSQESIEADLKSAFRDVRRYANGTDPDNETTRRSVAAAERRIMKRVVREIE